VKIPRSIVNLTETFEKLPGIGPKTAQRLTFYLLNFPQQELEKIAKSFSELKAGIQKCEVCHNISDHSVCSVCSDYSRDKYTIAVVSTPLDVFALEKTGFKGVYHVLHGLINPLENIGPDELYISTLVARLRELLSTFDMSSALSPQQVEIILATSTSMEGESTAMFISKIVKAENFGENIKITRIARGLPVGGDIEYADDNTLSRALEGRNSF
jgi:recombination protein RecR